MSKLRSWNILILLFIATSILFFTRPVNGQQADSTRTSYTITGKKPNIINLQTPVINGFNYWEEEFRGHWSGIFLGVNGFSQADYSNFV